MPLRSIRVAFLLAFVPTLALAQAPAGNPEPGLLFYLSGDHGTTADFSAGHTAAPNFDFGITQISDGAKGAALSCSDTQQLAYWAPGNIYAQRGTLSFYWRSRTPVGATAFPVFRVGYAEHSSWDMVWLRIDYNGHGFDAFVTDASLARTRVSVTLDPFPAPNQWTHLAFSWDETRGIRFYVNGKLAAAKETAAVYNAALDQFGPHSRIISPWHVQSDYNFVRGGDIDEVRIYDRMLADGNVAALARGEAAGEIPAAPARDLAEARWQDEWAARYGWNRPSDPPPYLAGAAVSIRKVEIHDAYDFKRWWFKATDGIRETTWPGVYNRSRLPGRNDYFQLPDWDCYSLSGKSITFYMPDEPWNHLEISGAAYGTMTLLADSKANPQVAQDKVLFERPKDQERTIHVLDMPITGHKIRFDNVMQEEPIGELSAYNVTEGREPAGSLKLAYRLAAVAPDNPSLAELVTFIAGRSAPDERATLVAEPANSAPSGAAVMASGRSLPIVNILVPRLTSDPTYNLDAVDGGLDGIAIDLPALNVKPTHGAFFPLNIQVKDPLWPLRDLLDFTFSVKPGEAKTLWLDLRDRLLPPGKSLYLTISGAGADFGAPSLAGARIRLVFKPKAEALAEDELDRFTEARDEFAMLVEEHPNSDKYHLWSRFADDIKDLMRVNPNHYPGRNYYAVAFPGTPWPAYSEPTPPAGVPLWAFRQVEALGHVKYFVNWWIDNRQVENGEYGGGLSDDTDLTNSWPGMALMGITPDKIGAALKLELDACYREGMIVNGLCAIQADELHGYEEGTNCLGQNLILNYGSPKMLERAMENARGIAWLSAINPAGNRFFQSCYYNGAKLGGDTEWGYTKSAEYLILQPQQLLIEYNGNPTAKKVELEMADGLLAHRHKDESGRFVIPSAVHFSDDKEAVTARAALPWPLFWTAYKWTGDRKYLAPIFDGGAAALTTVNANLLDLLDLRQEWGQRMGQAVGIARGGGRVLTTKIGVGDYGNTNVGEHFQWQVTGDKHPLEVLYDREIREEVLGEFINTQGSLWIDRVGVPYAALQRARLGGIALTRGNTFPGHVVSWKFAAPANDQSVAILVPHATPKEFKVIAYNLETSPVHALMTGWNVDPGVWEVTQGIDTTGSDKADQAIETRSVPFERSQGLDLTFAPRATTVLTFALKRPGTPYWQRPDLGIDPEDVLVNGREVLVRVHSLGSVDSPETTVVFRNPAGRIVATETVPSIPAPIDLHPKLRDIRMTLPDGMTAEGGSVEIDPDHKLEEITRLNNVVKVLPASMPYSMPDPPPLEDSHSHN